MGKRTNQTSAPSPVEKEKPVRGAKAKVTKKPANRLRGKIVVGGEKPKIVAKKVQPRKVIGLRKGPLAKKAVASTKKTTTKVAAKAAAKVAAKVTAKVAVKVTTKKALAVPKKVLPARKTLALRKATAPAPKKAPVVEKVTAVKKTVSKKVPVSAKKAIAARKAAEAEKILAERVASVPVTIPEKPQPKQKTTRTFKIVKKKVVKRTINQTIFRQTVTISTESTRTTVLKPPTKTTFVRPLTAVEFEAGTFRKPHKKRVPKVTTVDTATAGTPAPEETTPLIKPERPSDEELIQNDAAQDSIIGPLPEKVLAPVVLDTIVVVG